MTRPMAVKASSNQLRIFVLLPKALLFLTLLGATSTVTHSQSLPFSERSDWGPSAYALGGSGVASFSSLDAFAINPAGLAYYREKSAAGGDYNSLPGDLSSWSLTAIDGTSRVIAGVRFRWTDWESSSRHQYQFAAVYPTKWVWYGVSLQTEYFRDLSGPGNGWHFTGTTGIIGNLSESFSIGASIKHFLDREKDSQFPPLLRLGASYLYPKKFRATFDTTRRFKISGQDWNYSTGLEVLWEDWFALQGGYHFNNSDEDSFWALGLGLRAPRIDVGFAFHQTTESMTRRGFSGEATLKF